MNEYSRTVEAIRRAYGRGDYTVDRLICALEFDEVLDIVLAKNGLRYYLDDDTKDPVISAALDDIYNAALQWQELAHDGSGRVWSIDCDGIAVRAQLGALERAIGLNSTVWPIWERTICAAIDRDDYAPALEFALEGQAMDDGSIYAPICTPWTGAEEGYRVTLKITGGGKISDSSVEAAARDYVAYMRECGKLEAAMQWVEAM